LTQKKKTKYPLIEIGGTIDCGKRAIAQLVARKFVAVHIEFPIFNPPYSASGTGLLEALTTRIQELERNPLWWCHMYAANLYESRDRLLSLLDRMPVVVTNYIHSFRIWAHAMNLDMTRFYHGYTIGLPAPNMFFCVQGQPWATPGNLPVKFSPQLKHKIDMGFRGTSLACHKMLLTDDRDRFRHIILNKAAQSIALKIKSKYPDMQMIEGQLYGPQHFTNKANN
jgi:hypothetical protein